MKFGHLSSFFVAFSLTNAQVDFGAVWPHSFAGILNAKIGNAQVRRKIALEGHRFTPKEALDAGIVDRLVSGDTAAVLAQAEELALTVGVKAQGAFRF